MSTAQEIEDAIRSLSPSEREKLLQHIPQIFRSLPVTRSGSALPAMIARVRL